MPNISIEIPVTWGNRLSELLEAIRIQTYQDYEISVATSLPDGKYIDMLRSYGANIIHSGPNLLEKRYLSHSISRGKFALLLDETRIPEKNLLERLSNSKSNVVVIQEIDIGNSFWVAMANLDKLNSIECNKLNMASGFVLPRYINFELLSKAFYKIKENLRDETFRSVLMEDHQLISFEIAKMTDSMSFLRGNCLKHYGDKSIRSIVKKYHRYGKFHRILRNTVYEGILSPTNRLRKICIGSRIKLYIFYLARGIPFIVGYYLV